MGTIERGAAQGLTRPLGRMEPDRRRARGTDPIARRHGAMHELCHDVRQPAAAIAAMVAAVESDTDLPPAAQEWMRRITMETRRITELCREVLGQGPGVSSISLGDLVSEIVASAQLTSPATVTFEGGHSVVDADSAAMRRAIWNLVDNAERAAGAGGRVTVTTHASADVATVVVADSGPGFGKGGSGVAGLGLRIAGRVARDLGGRLTIGTSTVLGGAEVALSIPVSSCPGVTPTERQLAP